MSLFTDLQAKAVAEIAALKADLSSVEDRIEAAFNLGAMHQALQAIINDSTTVEAKVLAAFHYGQQAK
jgi:hypothetical protein